MSINYLGNGELEKRCDNAGGAISVLDTLKAENYELAQGSAMQKLYDEIKEMRSWFTEILIREKNK